MSTVLSRREWLRLGLLAGAAACAWLLVSNLWIPEMWTAPASYNVDALETLTRFRITQEQGPLFNAEPVVERLGAPWGADWSGYPLPDGPWYAFVGIAAKAIGLAAASNLALMLSHLLAVLTFYLCGRALGHRPAFAAAAALVFGFSYSIFHRGLSHHSFALAFTVPPALLVAWWIGAGGRIWTRRGPWIASIAAAVAIGVASPYFVFLFLQLCVLAIFHQALTRRHRLALRAGLFTLLACLLAFSAAHLPSLRDALAGETPADLVRNYAGTEIYGLKPVELLVPPPSHRWAVAADLGRLYAASTSLRGELFTPYLGAVGLMATAAMFLHFLLRLARNRGGLRPAHASFALWIALLATVGGLNSMLALAGLDQFRAGNRYSIHLLAIALFFASSWASRRFAAWPAYKTWLIAVPVVAIALWDQAPPAPSAAHRASLFASVEADRAAGAELEASLPPGSLVFQLPATPFPEAGTRGAMGDYEHLRLFLGTRDLRFSYGALDGSSAQGLVERVSLLPPAELVATVEGWGFAALVIDRRAYPDSAAALLDGFAGAGRPASTLAGRPELAVVPLRPSRLPAPPDPHLEKYRPAWSPATARGDLTVHALPGWFALEHTGDRVWRWAGRRATLGVWNDTQSPRRARLSGNLQTASPGVLSLRLNGNRIQLWKLRREIVSLDEIAFTLPPGASKLEWRFHGRLIRPDGDSRALGFHVENLAIVAD